MNSIIYFSENNKIKVIDLRKEYNGYKDNIPFAIVTDLSEDELISQLGNAIEQFSPYVILTNAMYTAMRNSFLNDERERLRNIKYHNACTFDEALCLIDEYADPAVFCESVYTMNCILERIKELPGDIGLRVFKRYIIGFSAREIATQEGTSFDEVRKSIYRAKPDIHNIFVDLEVVA